MVIVVYIFVTFMIAKQEYIKEKFNAGQNSYSLTTKAPSLHNGGGFSQRVTVKSVIFQIQMREAFFPIA